MPNLPMKGAAGAPDALLKRGPGGQSRPREALCYATGWRSNRVDRRNRAPNGENPSCPNPWKWIA
eukprot:4885823-Alexandrium_andersonii.AAC.1